MESPTKDTDMKKKIIVVSLLVLIATLFSFIRGMYVPYSVICKEEMKFCSSGPQLLKLVQDNNRKLIKTGDLSFKCVSLDKTRGIVERCIKQFDGFISDERLSVHEKRSSQWMQIRVPASHFDALAEAISQGASRLEGRSIRVEDVTDQYLDTETRLAVKRELEARYRELLPDAQTVKDILAIEEQIAKLREDIESAEGQLKRFDNRIMLSTLEVTFYETTDGAPVQFAKHFRNGIENGWDNLIWFFVGLVNIWPFVLIILAVLTGFRIRSR
jgi:hypothetical protein